MPAPKSKSLSPSESTHPAHDQAVEGSRPASGSDVGSTPNAGVGDSPASEDPDSDVGDGTGTYNDESEGMPESQDTASRSHLDDPRSAKGVTANPMNAQRESDDVPPARPDLSKSVIDPIVERVSEKWHDARAMVEDLERHAARSHGLTPDVDLIKDVAVFLRHTFDLGPRDVPGVPGVPSAVVAPDPPSVDDAAVSQR